MSSVSCSSVSERGKRIDQGFLEALCRVWQSSACYYCTVVTFLTYSPFTSWHPLSLLGNPCEFLVIVPVPCLCVCLS